MALESVAKGWGIFTSSMRHSYDYIGIVMVASALWFVIGLLPVLFTGSALFYVMFPQEQEVLFLPPVSLVVVLLLALAGLLAPSTTAVYGMTGAIVAGRETEIKDFFRFFARFFWRSGRLALVNAFLLLVLVVDLYVALTTDSQILRILAGLWVWLLVFWFMMSNWLWPLLVQQEIGTLKIMQRAALLALDNVVVSVALFLQALLVLIISLFLQVPMLLLFMGVVSFIHNIGLAETMKKYDTETSSSESGGEQAADADWRGES